MTKKERGLMKPGQTLGRTASAAVGGKFAETTGT